MSFLPTFRKWLGRALAAVLLIWPLLHIGLVHLRDLNSWKLAGWGMYATMHPNHVGIHGIVIQPGSRTLRDLEIGQAVATRHLAVHGDDPRRISLRDLPPEDGQELRRLLDRVRVLRSRGAMVAAADRLRTVVSQPGADVLFLLVVPRLDLFAKRTYTETAAYLVRDGRAQEIGRFATDREREEQILLALSERVLDRRSVAATDSPRGEGAPGR